MLASTLKPGDTIHICAPASRINQERFIAGCAILQHRGYKLDIHPQTYLQEGQSAGPIAIKVEALNSLLSKPGFVWAAGGGNRTAHTLPGLDLKHAKATLVGFSDITGIHSALYKHGKASIFGPTVQSLARVPDTDRDSLFALLGGTYEDFPLRDAAVINSGEAEGKIFAATLSVLTSMMGTKYAPDLDGVILCLEDANEELSRVDRMLWQLSQALPFSKLKGLMFGSFDPLLDSGTPFGFTFEQIVREHTGKLGIPVLINAPFGHVGRWHPLINGAEATLSASVGNASLRYKAA
jgi:muramoyltetrapeptide carboxypeptidase